MSTSSRQVGQQFEHCLSNIRQAAVEILTLLKMGSRKATIFAGFLNSSIRPALISAVGERLPAD